MKKIIPYAGTRKGLYRSINSGLSWSLYNNSFTHSKNVIGISKDPGTGESLYACTSDAVYKVWGPYIDTSSIFNISGYATFADNNQPVQSGYVKALKYYSEYRTLLVGQNVLDTIHFFLTRVTEFINKSSSSTPTSFKLHQNYPNPFNPMTTLKLDIPPISNNPPARSGGKGVFVKLIIYDITGREIAVLLNTELQPGTYTINWDASDYVSGLYFYKLITDKFVQTKKMVLIK